MTNYKVKKPRVSVYMPVFNAAPYLSEAVESILSQTYKNFEFIIVDDHSTDQSWNIIKRFARRDRRIRAFRNPINFGVSLTSNIAISKARSKFLARMDADDISVSDRLEKQLRYLQDHSDVVVVGGQCTIINENNQTIGIKRFPINSRELHDMLFWAVPIQQGYMMINRQTLPKNFVWYSPSHSSAEEVDLYFRLLRFGRFANLKDNLYFYRQLNKSLSHRNPKTTFWLTLQSRLNAIESGFTPSIKALLINLAEIILIAFLPSALIYQIWYFYRGVSQLSFNSNHPLASNKV